MSVYKNRQITIEKKLSNGDTLIKIACNNWGTWVWLDINSVNTMKNKKKLDGYNLMEYVFDGRESYLWLSDIELQDLRGLL